MTNSKQFLNKLVTVKIDRPIGSKHSKEYPNTIYPVNYGYIPNTVSGDGEELDCYILGINKPLSSFTGKCIAIIHRINDNDDKLVIAPEDQNFSDKKIRELTNFIEGFFDSIIIR